MNAIYLRRKAVNRVALSLALGAAGFGLFWLVAILWTLLFNGLSSINLALFTENTPPPGGEGGLLNAIFGSVVMTTVATLVGTPVGIMAGTYLAEFGRGAKLAEVVRFINDILLSAPSIMVGLFIYEVVVVRMGHFSAWAGALALAVIVIPVVVRTTEDMLKLVPNSLREAAAALGAPQWKVITLVAYRAARNGIITGVLLAIARISGETAPLLFTALNNQFWSADMNAPMANLPVVIFQYAMSPYEDWRQLAWGGALLITVTILLLNIGARVLAGLGTTRK
ncbi:MULTISPECIES: phosphate ABC transporter permease PstA [Azospirillum]|uniref:Phosphate transport system permease protein PstA n=1 Tax=Azospirillum rugosum TaxID=416170 RepID=A0ABS4SJ87_9PROT|nr:MULTISPECIES: phosphate ABC transporter permease PstA [Azospirillum]MBP2292638.1 phosphate transport system permease protein [Azospirillum rugosum]MCW2242871.1 phosphate transport system permease protein [Azospirillum canadense]MDQ0526338.1 phosphate transport system permease protein [Azospirillum rugosum]